MTRVFIAFLLIFQVGLANAHDGRPVYLEVNQLSDTEYELAWRIPSTVEPMNLPAIYLEGSCDEKKALSVTTGLLGKRLYECVGRDVSLQVGLYFPRTNPSLSSIVRIERSGFPSKFLHAGPGVTLIKIPPSIDDNSLLSEYGKLGVEHILRGYDHLLFLLCVVWLAFTFKRIVLAVTGFTIAHSITLGLAALGVVTPAIEPTEALIALSIIFVAAELARQNRDSLSWRYPVAVSSVFGLLHGFGFASVLKEIGLPTNDILMALLAFNLGVEAGQLLFIVALVILVWSIQKTSAGKFDLSGPLSQKLGGYVVGIFATFWFFERLATFV
jgi:hydrogenase/urease accessory protein HupE|tara:strand:+ start:1417 stop:2400 length:984 start_codon:yes stop_codon:yes gene_type:complete